MGYTLVSRVAENLQISAATIQVLAEEGLVDTTPKQGQLYLAGAEIYKLRFIVYLERHHQLELPDIKRILQRHKPPYTNWRAELKQAVR
jgi:DNA-binding transcriptional MerR regulator